MKKKQTMEKLNKIWKHNWQLYLLILPGIVWMLIFMYAPMYGLLIAFKDFNASLGIMGSPWAGMKYFEQFFSTQIAWDTIYNTFVLSGLQLLFSFPAPIIFALLLNQINNQKYKKFIQTASFAPYFVSNVVVVSMMTVILSPSGFVNTAIHNIFGGEPLYFMSQAQYFRPLYVGSGVWQTMGFNAIIYIAALSNISPDYYEAAIMDGASKLKRIIYIDIPLIMPTITIMLILAIGNLMTVGYEKAFLMQNGTNTAVSELISTYVYKTGLIGAQFSFATAVGLFNSVVNLALLFAANTFAKKVMHTSLY